MEALTDQYLQFANFTVGGGNHNWQQEGFHYVYQLPLRPRSKMRKHSSHHNTATSVRKRCDDKISYYFCHGLFAHITPHSLSFETRVMFLYTRRWCWLFSFWWTRYGKVSTSYGAVDFGRICCSFCRGGGIGFFKANTLTILDEAWKDMQACTIS